jgi:hypothetical protein
MVTRSSRLAVLLAIVPAVVIGCRQEQGSPVELPTVRLAVVAGAEHGGRPYSTPMTQEVTVSPPWQGDADGTGQALITVNVGQGEICWELSASNIKLPSTFAHIHKAAPGIRGDIVVTLSPPGAGGTSTGCDSTVRRELAQDILANPAGYYVNVHNSDYPAGAIRGQLGN